MGARSRRGVQRFKEGRGGRKKEGLLPAEMLELAGGAWWAFTTDTTKQGSAVPGEWQGEGDAAGVCDWMAQVSTAAIACRGVHVKWEKQMP